MDFPIPAEVRVKLLAISASTIDRLLHAPRGKGGSGSRQRRSANPLIKPRVRVRTFADWDDPPPGFFEGDFVAHNGGSSVGCFLHTLVLTDIATGWTECLALLVREQSLVCEALDHVSSRLPFALCGLDTDNDSAFMNETMLAYCAKRKIELTRSRPYRKNDQAWVEQKNGAVARRFAGHHRYAGLEACRSLARLYEAVRLYVNFFQPSFKLLEKTREGANVKKRYSSPQTPCQRLLASPHLSLEAKENLRSIEAQLDPLQLLHAIRLAQEELLTLPCPVPAPRDASGPADDLEAFFRELPDLWRKGDPRKMHRKRETPPRTWRTRPDPFSSVRTELRAWFQAEPDITAKELFLRLQAKYPEPFPTSQLRTLQRRLKEWRRELAHDLIHAGSPPSGILHQPVLPDPASITRATTPRPPSLLPSLHSR